MIPYNNDSDHYNPRGQSGYVENAESQFRHVVLISLTWETTGEGFQHRQETTEVLVHFLLSHRMTQQPPLQSL